MRTLPVVIVTIAALGLAGARSNVSRVHAQSTATAAAPAFEVASI